MTLRTIRVTTREELATALHSADRVVVEGDDALLSYAIAQASDPGHHIDVEFASPAPAPSFKAPLAQSAAAPAPIPSGFESVFEPPTDDDILAGGGLGDASHLSSARPVLQKLQPAARSFRAAPYFVWAVIAFVAVGVAATLATSTLWPRGANPSPQQPALATIRPQPAPAIQQPSAQPLPPPTAEPSQIVVTPKSAEPRKPVVTARSSAAAASATDMIQAIAWPIVAIIAIVSLALIARQAIAAGRNVEFSWKVTEKVSGRVVITKVKNPQSRRGRPAPV